MNGIAAAGAAWVGEGGSKTAAAVASLSSVARAFQPANQQPAGWKARPTNGKGPTAAGSKARPTNGKGPTAAGWKARPTNGK